MSNFLPLLPLIILAQALGVGLAWGIDAISWKWRSENEDHDDGFSFGVMVLLLPPLTFLIFGASFDVKSTIFVLEFIFAPTLLWLLIVTWAQRGRAISWRITFFGAMMQFVCFVMVLLIGSVVCLLSGGFIFASTYFVTATLTYVLLSLFRPTIYGAWKTWRQKSGENGRLR